MRASTELVLGNEPTYDQMKELLAARIEIAHERYQEALALLDAFAPSSPLNQAAKLILKGRSFARLHATAKAYSAYCEAQPLAPDLAALGPERRGAELPSGGWSELLARS